MRTRGRLDLEEARLQILLLLDEKSAHLHALTALVEGKRTDGTPWALAVHLEDDRPAAGGDRKGAGACGHAALHCHVGPGLGTPPKVRVPLPPLGPRALVSWVLSQVIPSFEPAPWEQLAPRLEA